MSHDAIASPPHSMYAVPHDHERVSRSRRDLVSGAELGRELAAHHERSFGWALACCRGNRQTAEEVLHTSYLKVLDGRARFAGRSSFRTWLFAVIRTTAREGRRQTLRRWLALERHARARPTATPPRQELGPDARKLRTELDALPRRQREVLHLVFYGELSIREASEVMNVSLGTARTHYERGKRRLRERLGLEGSIDG